MFVKYATVRRIVPGFQCSKLLKVVDQIQITKHSSGATLIDLASINQYLIAHNHEVQFEEKVLVCANEVHNSGIPVCTIKDIHQFQDRLGELTSTWVKMRRKVVSYPTDHLLPRNIGKVCCIDIEMFERKQSIILEVGIAKIRSGRVVTDHYVVEQHLKYRNGKFVPDNRNNFLFGTTQVTTMGHVREQVEKALQWADTIVGHGIISDVQCIRKNLDLHVTNQLIDTGKLGKELMDSHQQRGLGFWLERYGIDNRYHHNGGNDAHRNLTLFRMMLKDIWEKRNNK